MAQYLPPESLRVGNGTETTFGFTFPYLLVSDIALTVDGTATPVVLVGTAQVSIVPAPALGAKIRIYRNTPAQFPKYLFATGVPMLPRYIDENNRQLLYSLQEGLLDFDTVAASVADALDAADRAADSASSAAASATTATEISMRAIRTPITEAPVPPLPPAASRVGRYLGFDSQGNPALLDSATGDIGDFAVNLLLSGTGRGAHMVGYGTGTVHDYLAALDTQGVQRLAYATVALDCYADLLTARRDATYAYQVRSVHRDAAKGGGVLYWDPSMPQSMHDGGVVISGAAVFPTDWDNATQRAAWFAPGTGTGCFRRDVGAEVRPTWYGARGFPYIGDSEPIQRALDFAGIRSDAQGRYTEVEGEHLHCHTREPVVIRKGRINLRNLQITQTINTQDAMHIDGSGNPSTHLFYLHFQNVTLNVAGTAATTSGSQLRILAGIIGWWHWDRSYLGKGGRHGIINGYNTAAGVNGKKGGILWELTLDNLWWDATYGSAVQIPAQGGVLDFNVTEGGSTTFTWRNLHATNIVTSAPAYQAGNGVDHLVMTNVTADHCTRLYKGKVKTTVVDNVAMEFVRPPVDTALNTAFYAEPSHFLIDFQNGFGFELNGVLISAGPEILAKPHANTAYVNAEFILGEVNTMGGSDITGSAPVRVSGGSVSVRGVSNSSRNIKVNRGQILYPVEHATVSAAQASGTFALFPIDPLTQHAYLITLEWAFANQNSINTFLVHTAGTAGGLTGSASLLLGATAYPGASITFPGGVVTATVPANTAVNWRALDLTKL